MTRGGGSSHLLSRVAIVEEPLIELLLDQGGIVVCTGGGGVPVVRDDDGELRGVEAVIDKDRSSSILAVAVKADVLLILTDVNGIETNLGTPEARLIRETSPSELRKLDFPAGSMGPKVDAVCDFVERSGRRAGIGSLKEAEAILSGDAGTSIIPTERRS